MQVYWEMTIKLEVVMVVDDVQKVIDYILQ